MAKKDIEKKYKTLEVKYRIVSRENYNTKQELEKIKKSRIFKFVNRLPINIKNYLLFVKEDEKDNLTNSNENKSIESITNIDKDSLDKNIKPNDKKYYEIIKKFLIKIKDFLSKLWKNIFKITNITIQFISRKINEIYYLKYSKVTLFKTKVTSDLNEKRELIKDELTVVICIEEKTKDKLKVVYKILHQSYINYKIVILNISSKEIDLNEYLNLDSRISFENLSKEESIIEFINSKIKSEYILITNDSNSFNYNIKRIIKTLKKEYNIFLKNKNDEKKYVLSFKKDNIDSIKEYLN